MRDRMYAGAMQQKKKKQKQKKQEDLPPAALELLRTLKAVFKSGRKQTRSAKKSGRKQTRSAKNALEEKLSSCGLTPVDVPSDGSCQFSALAHQLSQHGESTTADAVRSTVAQYLG